MTEHEKPDLSKIEPIGRPLDADDGPKTAVSPVGGPAAAIPGSPSAMNAEDAATAGNRDLEPKTSPETDAELEQLRRG
jgi:hypothetical protein